FQALTRGESVCGIVAAYLFRVSKPGQDIFVGAISKWVTSQIALTLWTNIYCSVFIAGRIYYRKRQSAAFAVDNPSSSLSKVLIIFIESASFYALWIIAFAICYFTGSSVAFVFSDSWASVAGMTFLSINARVFLTSNSKSLGGNTSEVVSRPIFALRKSQHGTHTNTTGSIRTSSMPVTVSVAQATAEPETGDGISKEESRWNAA
ncbi:hypothetical protein V5O48_012591, partial [Marasmius crinis-equi]